MKGRHLREYAAEARDAWNTGDTTFVTSADLNRAGMMRPDRALRGLDEIIAAVQAEGWVHVETAQVLTRITVYFVRGPRR